MLDMRLSNKEI